jgi:CheY-like chemotaxis protein
MDRKDRSWKNQRLANQLRNQTAAARERRLIILPLHPQLLPLCREPGPLREAPGILVVDDDEMLRNLMRTVLQRRGFQVFTAASGAEAVALYLQQREQIAVVLLDVRMPVQDGPETLAQLRRINPSLCCCFMSGHTGEYTLSELLARGASHCFDKPFRLEEVAQTLLRLAQAS